MSDEENQEEIRFDADPMLIAPLSGPKLPESEMGESFAITNAKYVALDAFLKLLTRDQTFSEFSREILLVFMNVIKSEAGSILEVDHKNNVLFFRAVAGQSSAQISEFTVPMGQGIAGHVAESRQTLVVSNVKENRIHLKAIEKVVGFETRNLVALPIVLRGSTYGVIELLNRVGEESYTPADLELLGYLCEMASCVIEIRMMLAWVSKKRSESGDTPSEAA